MSELRAAEQNQPNNRELRMGTIYRYARPELPEHRELDAMPNFYWHTFTDGMPKAKLERGISRLPCVQGDEGERVPAFLLRSTPWKAGSEATPWHDSFDRASGTVTYFGDNRLDPATGEPKHAEPGKSLGNSQLETATFEHQSNDDVRRDNGGPILLFTGVPHAGRQKGNVRFDGLGVLTRVEIVNHDAHWSGSEFRNFKFEVQLLDLEADDWTVRWEWIARRRSAEASPNEIRPLAPTVWKRWCKEGHDALPELKLRRFLVEPLSLPRPPEGSAATDRTAQL